MFNSIQNDTAYKTMINARITNIRACQTFLSLNKKKTTTTTRITTIGKPCIRSTPFSTCIFLIAVASRYQADTDVY